MKFPQRKIISILMMLVLILAPALGTVAGADCLTTTGSVTADIPPSLLTFSTSVTDDFDSDNLPDQADFSSHNTINVRLGNAQFRQLTFEPTQISPGRLVSDDVDNDHDEDLVWISENNSIAPVVWLGDGKGQFVKAQFPESYCLVTRLVQSGNHTSRLFDEQDQNELASDSVTDHSIGLLADENSKFEARVLTAVHTFSNCTALPPCLTYLYQRGPPTIPAR